MASGHYRVIFSLNKDALFHSKFQINIEEKTFKLTGTLMGPTS
jgi:hypothetical protein